MSARRPRPSGAARRGLTLAEMVIALAVAAVVLLGAQSAIMVASRAVPDRRSPAHAALEASSGVERMMAELCFAKSLVAAGASRVAFTVADRTGDAADETIEYSWSGKAGDPVLRVMNGGTPEPVIGAADSVAWAYDTVTEPDDTATITGPETLLASSSNLVSLSNQSIDSSHAAAACFTPAMPANAVSFAVTRATINLRSNGSATGVTLVQVRTAWNGQPTTRVVDQSTLAESGLATLFGPKTVSFVGNAAIPAGSPVALVLQLQSNGPSCDAQVATLAIGLGGYTYAVSGDSGVTWTTAALKQLNFAVYGTITTRNVDATVKRVTNVRCSVSTPGSRATLAAGTRLLNEPLSP